MTASVDGKTSKQILDKDGDVLSMLNVFEHDMLITLMEWSIKGDKTNELGCLKQHLPELLKQYPQLDILTGDAIFSGRTLLEVMKDKVDYVFQIKDNQEGIKEAVEVTFANREQTPPAAESPLQKLSQKNVA